MAAGEWSTATAAVGKGESTQGRAVLWANRGHGCLLRLNFGLLMERAGLEARCLQLRFKARAQAGVPFVAQGKPVAIYKKKGLATRGAMIYRESYRNGKGSSRGKVELPDPRKRQMRKNANQILQSGATRRQFPFILLASGLVSRYYLDMLRFDWDERKNKSIGRSMEFGLKRRRAFSAIHMHAYSMIRNTPRKRSGSSCWD